MGYVQKASQRRWYLSWELKDKLELARGRRGPKQREQPMRSPQVRLQVHLAKQAYEVETEISLDTGGWGRGCQGSLCGPCQLSRLTLWSFFPDGPFTGMLKSPSLLQGNPNHPTWAPPLSSFFSLASWEWPGSDSRKGAVLYLSCGSLKTTQGSSTPSAF